MLTFSDHSTIMVHWSHGVLPHPKPHPIPSAWKMDLKWGNLQLHFCHECFTVRLVWRMRDQRFEADCAAWFRILHHLDAVGHKIYSFLRLIAFAVKTQYDLTKPER